MTVGSWEEPVSVSLSSPGLVSGVAPARGPAGGGTLLELQGAAIGDSKALHCSVGAVAPVAARWADAQAVECEAPAHAPGGAAVGLGVSAQLRVRGAEFTFTEAGAAGGAAAEPQPEPETEPETEPEEAASGGGGLERAAAVEEALAAAAVPRVTRVRPASGPAGGGTTVYVAGEGLHGGLVCSFGTVSRVASRWASGSGVECVSPARAPGAVELELEADAGAVSVRSRDGERFTYVPEARVESVQPASGPTRGGTEVQLQGSGLAPGQPLGCWVGGRVAAGSAGFAGVAVGAGAAGLGEEAAVFLYREPAQVRGAFPRAAWHGGGALVHVSGQALVGSEAACRAVGPGAAPLASHGVSSALVVCETGAEEPGSMEVLMTVGSWEEPVSVSLSSPGLVSGVAPARGPAGGGTLLELQGAAIGDSKALHCSVGAVAPVAARWADAQAVECEAPAHAPGGAAVGLGVSAQLRVRGAEFTFTEAGAAGGAAVEPQPEPETEPETEPEEAASGGGGLERAAAVEEALAAAAVPRVTRVRPASGPAGGGTTVYVAGEGLHGGLVCSFGTVSRVASRWASGSGVECVSPARAPGAVELELEADAGAVSVRSRDGERFTYVPE